ncbi:uncharacterized protein LOC127262700 [Andrographis paniculata]|uniref:uncharacterized protein LOC127262700 n=1 Tax=Andrographis paniculata TaxID=175694 RepID=UPI0021E7C9E8|nr:uncharacterized protein LOC127262700 [Andrographis paniculata]
MPELHLLRLTMFLRRLEAMILDLGDVMHSVYVWIFLNGDFGLRLLWHIMHLMLSFWYLAVGWVNALESFLISSGMIKKYKDLDVSRVKYLAVVIDSEEARHTLKVLDLLRWLDSIGVRNVCLYDSEGVLKKSKDALTLWLKSERLSNAIASNKLPEQKYMSMEVISYSDGKHAVAKAANVLLKKYYLNSNSDRPKLTEADMTSVLGEIGYGPEPDLMLVYAPARCHMGFPAWRIRYTEIVHLGPLKSMKFGALIKAIHRFTMVHQNYGS